MGKKAILSAISSPLSDLASRRVNRREKGRKYLMNPMIQFKKATVTVLGAFALTCLGLLPQVQALLPPEIPGNPDGCYPGFNTAEGCNALFNVTGGVGDTGVGWFSLFIVGDASFNTGVGAAAWL